MLTQENVRKFIYEHLFESYNELKENMAKEFHIKKEDIIIQNNKITINDSIKELKFNVNVK